MLKSVRWYLVAAGLTVASITATILGDRAAKQEIQAKHWSEALVDNAEKVKTAGGVSGDVS